MSTNLFMFTKTNIQPIKFIFRLISLCALLTIVSCNKQCKPRLPHASAPFKLKIKKEHKHLTEVNNTIRFKVVKNKKHQGDSSVTDNLLLRITRKEGKTAKITGRQVRPLEPSIFEYEITQIDTEISELQIELEDKDEQKAAFELELVHHGTFLGNPKNVEFENKDINITIHKISKKLYDEQRSIELILKNKGNDLPQDGELSIIFTRKEGHKAAIKQGNESIETLGPNHEGTGIFKMPIKLDNKEGEQNIPGLKLHIEEGETKAVFEVYLAYKGTKISKTKKIVWLFKKVNLALEIEDTELRGDQKKIGFFVKRSNIKALIGEKSKKVEELDRKLVLRITRVLDTNAIITGATSKGDTKGTYELTLDQSDIETTDPIQRLNIQVDEGDKLAKFKLQLVYDNMNVGKPEFVTWRDADVRLELINVSNGLMGEKEENKKIKFSIQNKGKDAPKTSKENKKTTLRIIRLKDTNATIEGKNVKQLNMNDKKVASGIWELDIMESELPNSINNEGIEINKLCIATKPGDKLAQFHLQLFYDGMEIGKPQLVTWTPNDVRLELKGVNRKLMGMEDRNIKFTIHKKGKHDPEANKPLLIRLTRHEGYNADLKFLEENVAKYHQKAAHSQEKDNGATFQLDNKQGGVFELTLPYGHIGNPIELLQIIPREGETRLEFKLQLVYDGIALGKPKKVIWEAEKVQLALDIQTEELRGTNTQISFKVMNKTKNGDKPEENNLHLRLTRKSGYNATIKGAEDKGNGLYELKIDTNSDLGRTIDNLTIEPRKGETKAEFKLQLVYKGLNIGSAKKIVWIEKDIQLYLSIPTKKLRGDNKQIKFAIANKGKDKPEDNKLFIRFSRDKGHMATILDGGNQLEETGAGFYEVPIDSKNIGNSIENFTIIPRPGERKAQFKMQLIYDGKDMGKAETVTWTEKIIGLSIKMHSNVLRGHGDENTTINFTIHRSNQGKTPENELEEKLRIRFKRQKGLATIVTTAEGREKLEESNPGIFEYAMPSGSIGNLIKIFKIKPNTLDTEALFSMELVYDGKTVGSAKKIKWTTEDIRPVLHIKNRTLRGNDNIIKFKVTNNGKDKLKQEDENKHEKGDELKIMFKRKAGNATIAINNNSSTNSIKSFDQTQYTYVLDNDHLNQYIDKIIIASESKTESSEFEIQLFLNGFPVGKPETIYWKNTFPIFT